MLHDCVTLHPLFYLGPLSSNDMWQRQYKNTKRLVEGARGRRTGRGALEAATDGADVGGLIWWCGSRQSMCVVMTPSVVHKDLIQH